MSVLLVYPHQLFEKLDFNFDKAILIQDRLFFELYDFHKQKLVLHRASMKFYADYLKSQGREVVYLESERDLAKHLKGLAKVFVYELSDCWLENKLRKACLKQNTELEILKTPNFLTPFAWSDDYFNQQNKYFFTSFYIERRKRLKILLDKDGKPKGGKWSFDAENRLKIMFYQQPGKGQIVLM